MNKIAKVAASVSLSLVILFATFFYVMGWETFYSYEIKKNNISQEIGISEEDLLPLYMVLPDYMVGNVESIQLDATVNGERVPMYNQREIDHMVDVRFLISKLKQVVAGIVILLALSVFYLVLKKDRIRDIFIGQFISTLVIFGGFLLMAVTDFTAYFLKFHELLFTNDLWLLDPKTDRMIVMLPEVFFRDIVLVMVVAYAFVSLFVAANGVLFALRHKKISEV